MGACQVPLLAGVGTRRAWSLTRVPLIGDAYEQQGEQHGWQPQPPQPPQPPHGSQQQQQPLDSTAPANSNAAEIDRRIMGVSSSWRGRRVLPASGSPSDSRRPATRITAGLTYRQRGVRAASWDSIPHVRTDTRFFFQKENNSQLFDIRLHGIDVRKHWHDADRTCSKSRLRGKIAATVVPHGLERGF